MFDRLSDKLTQTLKKVRGLHKISENNIDEILKELRTSLLEADVHFKVVKDFLNTVKEKSLGTAVIKGVRPDEQFIKLVQDELTHLMGEKATEWIPSGGKNFALLVVGLNGAGKTTFSAKIAKYLTDKKNKKVLLVPADTFRPAAKEQLKILAQKNNLPFFDTDFSQTPEKFLKAAHQYAEDHHYEGLIVDSAGRLQTDSELMQELSVMQKNLIKLRETQTLLVLDAMTGQESLTVAKTFHEKLKLEGTVLSKMDGDAKGGAALSLRAVTRIPILFLSTGEKISDLEIFHPDRLASRLLDKGDVVSLVEKAQEMVSEEEAQDLMKKMTENRFTLMDFGKQIQGMKKMGSFESILKFIPGVGGAIKQMGDLSAPMKEMDKFDIILSSMTHKEKENRVLLKEESRRKRVAKGSGTTLKDVDLFLRKFDEMQKMMGMFSGMGKKGLKGMGMPPFGQGGGPSKMPKNPKNSEKKDPWGKKYF
ncbi:MAG: signal recognition particle protein [Bacteriovoracaceae bacterium]|nr:signal recognition particle protein [Bacteriovoracaceae bacterium]